MQEEMYDMCMLIQFIIHRDSRKYLFENETRCMKNHGGKEDHFISILSFDYCAIG